MDRTGRTDREATIFQRWDNGPGAPVRATERALRKVETADAVIIVEGISDQIAVETLARRRGRDLDAEHVSVLPVGGVQAMERCRSTTFSYASPPCTLSRDPATSEQGFYTLELESDANSYTLTAKGIDVQANDTECLEMTIDHRDQKLPAACWD